MTLSAAEVMRLREVLHVLENHVRSFGGSDDSRRVYEELVEIRRGLGSTFYTP